MPPAELIHTSKVHVYYGDGKVFYRQPLQGLSHNGSAFQFTVTDPRVNIAGQSFLRLTDASAQVVCDRHVTDLRPVARDRADAMVGKAQFLDVFWTRRPHALARDEEGTYYYVDRLGSNDRVLRERRGFRVFRGELGKLRRLRMRNIAADMAGELFTTDRGALRLRIDAGSRAAGGKAVWTEKKTPRELLRVPLTSETRLMIYRDLGVYAGLKLKTMCDDL